MTHRTRTLSFTLALALVAVTGCKKDKGKGGTAADPAAGQTPAAGGATATTPTGGGGAAAPAAGGCPAGFTNPDGAGVCVKLVDGMTQSKDEKPAYDEKAVVRYTGDGDSEITIRVKDYDSMFWEQHNKDMLAGGGFGGTLKDQGKVGTDGVTATFSADSGTMERKLRITHIHNDKVEAECWAEKNVMSTVGPKLDDVLAVCQSATLAK